MVRYTCTWHVNQIFTHIESLGINNTLDNKCLTTKTAILLLLLSGQRPNTLLSLDIYSMDLTGDKMYLLSCKVAKTFSTRQSVR